jgi:hypothetical protein
MKMKWIPVFLISFLSIAALANAADLSTASSQELLGLYRQLRAVQGGGEAAITEDVVFKRDSATFYFSSGRINFAAPVAGRVLAAKFEGEGRFELEPPSAIDQRQIARFAKNSKLADTFREAIFYFTDDSYEEMKKAMKVRAVPGADKAMFSSSQKQYSDNYNHWWDNLRKGYPTIRNLAARMLADLTDSSSKGFFLADFKGSKSGNLLLQISWNREGLLLPGLSKGEEIVLLHLIPGEYFEWWSGLHLASEYPRFPRPDHRNLLAHCATNRIELDITKENALSAVAQMEVIANEGAVRVLPFNLNGVLRISSIEDGAGNKLDFIQEARELDSDPWVILGKPAKQGEKLTLRISYRENSTQDSRMIYGRGSDLFYVASRETWFPSLGSYDDKTQFEIRARSPKNLTFIATGIQTASEKDKDGAVVTSWKSEIPVSTIGFNYGRFVESIQSGENLKITAYAGQAPPRDLQAIDQGMSVAAIGKLGRSDNPIAKAGLNTTSTVKNTAATTFQAFQLYEFLFGKSPFRSVAVTEQPVRGNSQSWPNLVSLPYDALLDSSTQNLLGFQQSGEMREFYRTVVFRELSHQWWGHTIGAKTYHDQWLVEGGADFSAAMYLNQFQPKDMGEFRSMRRKWLLSKNSSGYRPVDSGPVWLNPQLNEYDQKMNSMFVVTYKGGYVLEMLRVLMHDPRIKNPDGHFITMMHDFTSKFAGQNASTEDFRKIVEQHNGKPMEWFFDQWVYGSETPNYDFSYQISDAGGGKAELSMTLTQTGVSEIFQMQLPLYLVVNGEQKYAGLIGVLGTKPVKATVTLPFRPEKVVLDPNRSILAEIRQ